MEIILISTLMVVKNTPLNRAKAKQHASNNHKLFACVYHSRKLNSYLLLYTISSPAPHQLHTSSTPAPHQLRTSSSPAPHQLHTESRSLGIFHSSGLAESAYFQSDSFCWGFCRGIVKKQIFVIMVVQNCK